MLWEMSETTGVQHDFLCRLNSLPRAYWYPWCHLASACYAFIKKIASHNLLFYVFICAKNNWISLWHSTVTSTNERWYHLIWPHPVYSRLCGMCADIATVIAPYQATGPEQLSLQPGQLIDVRKKNPSGWWEGELQASSLSQFSHVWY